MVWLAPLLTAVSLAGAPSPCHGLDPDDAWMNAFFARAQASLVAHRVDKVLPRAADHRLQVVVGEVKKTGDARCIDWHPYRMDAEYFYPASMVKPLAGLAALEVLRQRKLADPRFAAYTPDSPVRVDAARGAKVVATRTTTFRRELEAALVVSNNDAFNFLYEVAGRDAINQLWHDAGLKSVHMSHRLSSSVAGPSTSERLHADVGGVDFDLIGKRTEAPMSPLHGPGLRVGSTLHADAQGMDFSGRNAVSLFDLARMCAWIADPALTPELRWPGADEDRLLVRATMNLEAFDWALYRPLRAGLMEAIAGDDLVFVGKPGQAYGFFGDVAYVESRSTGRAFVVAAVLRPGPEAPPTSGRKDQHMDDVGTPLFLSLGEQLGRELLTAPR
jgi:hypothetical protein